MVGGGGGEDGLTAVGLLCWVALVVLLGVDTGGLGGGGLGATGTLLTTTLELDEATAVVGGGGGFALAVCEMIL